MDDRELAQRLQKIQDTQDTTNETLIEILNYLTSQQDTKTQQEPLTQDDQQFLQQHPEYATKKAKVTPKKVAE